MAYVDQDFPELAPDISEWFGGLPIIQEIELKLPAPFTDRSVDDGCENRCSQASQAHQNR